MTCASHADAIVAAPDGQHYFVEPHTERMAMRDFLSLLSTEEVRYFYRESIKLMESRHHPQAMFIIYSPKTGTCILHLSFGPQNLK